MPALPPIDELYCRLLRQAKNHAVLLIDTTGKIVAWSGAAEIVFGFTQTEALERGFADLFTPEDVAKGMPQFEMDVAAKNGHAENDRWMMRKDNSRFWATGILEPIRDESGQLLAYGKILRNRTDLKGQIEAAESRAESSDKANERKNAFIATLAHELRNPLASIAMALTVLERIGGSPDDCAFARATVARQLDHMRRMIEDLLDVAKSRVGKVSVNLQATTLDAIVAAAIETCRPAIDKRTHAFALIMPEAPILIRADEERLRQVFVNLIENAAKYTDRGGRIWVKVSVESDEAVVKVEDTGIGISPEMLPLIFDLFTQAEFDAQGGLGIGLSVVKDVTDQHGGSVQVSSDGRGKGSEFTVRLPLAGNDKQRPNRPGP